MLRKSLPNRSVLMRVTLCAIALGPIALHYLPRLPHVTPDLADGIGGFFYGVGIATFVLWARARR